MVWFKTCNLPVQCDFYLKAGELTNGLYFNVSIYLFLYFIKPYKVENKFLNNLSNLDNRCNFCCKINLPFDVF